MSAFDRYMFRTTFGAFLLVLISLTAVIWLTHALREIDLMTSQRQTILTFVGITGLLIPMLVLVIAPLAIVVAVGHTLNRLNTDSEIVVMNASEDRTADCHLRTRSARRRPAPRWDRNRASGNPPW